MRLSADKKPLCVSYQLTNPLGAEVASSGVFISVC